MSTEVSTDATQLVEEAFAEMQCEAERPIPHEGDIVALLVGHGCNSGQLLCAAHLKAFIDIKVPQLRARLDRQGHIECGLCHGHFGSVDDFCKVFTL